eukprot:734139-Prymnesium_polylepis.1
MDVLPCRGVYRLSLSPIYLRIFALVVLALQRVRRARRHGQVCPRSVALEREPGGGRTRADAGEGGGVAHVLGGCGSSRGASMGEQ